MDNVRILHGWTKDERKELEEAKDNGFLSVIALFCSIKRDDNNCHALYEKYYREDTNGNNLMAKDIIDFYCGNAKFPEQKYVVHDKVTDQYIYCNVLAKGKLHWWELGAETAERKTKEEWLKINPAYEAMLERVEDNEKI